MQRAAALHDDRVLEQHMPAAQLREVRDPLREQDRPGPDPARAA